MVQDYWLTMHDDTLVHVKKWGNHIKNPKAIIHLAHGMAEHIERYDDFARFLMNHEFVVYGNDHRGHGKTGEHQGQLGYFADEDGFDITKEDLFTINQHIKEKYPDTPIYLFGHSMGSFLVRRYIQTYSHSINGIILCGTGFFTKKTTYFGRKLAAALPPKKPSKLMNDLAFGTYNKHIKAPVTTFDWLSRDEHHVHQYMADSYCGFTPTARFFVDLMTGLSTIHDTKQNRLIRHDLPMLLVSGDKDPVGNYGKGIWKTAEIYQDAGLENVTISLFDGGRHELLNETNKTDIYQYLLVWLQEQITCCERNRLHVKNVENEVI